MNMEKLLKQAGDMKNLINHITDANYTHLDEDVIVCFGSHFNETSILSLLNNKENRKPSIKRIRKAYAAYCTDGIAGLYRMLEKVNSAIRYFSWQEIENERNPIEEAESEIISEEARKESLKEMELMRICAKDEHRQFEFMCAGTERLTDRYYECRKLGFSPDQISICMANLDESGDVYYIPMSELKLVLEEN